MSFKNTSLFLKRAQCPLWCYLDTYRPEKIPERKINSIPLDPSRDHLMTLIKKLNVFQPEKRNTQSVEYRQTFHEQGFRASFDVIRKTKAKTEAYLLKSSSKITQSHLLSSAFKYYVSRLNETKINSVYIIFVNKKYFPESEIDPEKLFLIRNITSQIKELQVSVSTLAESIKNILAEPKPPLVEIGPHCHSPAQCAFIDYCWKDVPPDSVFNISGMNKHTQFELFGKGIISLNDIDPEKEPGLSEDQKFQVRIFQSGRPHKVENKLKKFIEHLQFPLHFLDFEAFAPPIPYYENTRPFQFIPFQFSLHKLENPNAELIHREFLAETNGDPRKPLLEHLIRNLEKEGTILIYGDDLERSILHELKEYFPEKKEDILSIIERLADFSTPFRKKYYYHPSMNGSYSIKKITPALISEISYQKLAIRHGGEAARVYEALRYMKDAQERTFWKKALLQYCKTDTLVMALLYRILSDI